MRPSAHMRSDEKRQAVQTLDDRTQPIRYGVDVAILLSSTSLDPGHPAQEHAALVEDSNKLPLILIEWMLGSVGVERVLPRLPVVADQASQQAGKVSGGMLGPRGVGIDQSRDLSVAEEDVRRPDVAQTGMKRPFERRATPEGGRDPGGSSVKVLNDLSQPRPGLGRNMVQEKRAFGTPATLPDGKDLQPLVNSR